MDPDFASTPTKHTPTIICVYTGNYEILRLLIEADAEVNKPNAFN